MFSLANEKTFCKYYKIIRRFCFNRLFLRDFLTRKNMKITGSEEDCNLEIAEYGINGTIRKWNSGRG